MKLVIGELIPDKRNFLKTYMLHTECKHGNESLSTHRLRFSEERKDSLIHHFLFLSTFINKDMSNGKEVTEFAIAEGSKLDIENGPELVTNVIPRDNKYLGMLATLIKMNITYFDENGHEHYVQISQ